MNGFRIGRYGHDGTVSAIDYPENRYSIGNWWHINDPSINGFEICDEVREWWVWEDAWRNLYFSGYVGDKAWVFDATRGIVYTMFGRPKAIGDRSLFPGINNFICLHCGSTCQLHDSTPDS